MNTCVYVYIWLITQPCNIDKINRNILIVIVQWMVIGIMPWRTKHATIHHGSRELYDLTWKISKKNSDGLKAI